MPLKPTAKLSRSDLADLNAFRMVEKRRSFSKAAMELGITTSALSHAVKKLDARLGVRLLNRSSRHVAPTEAGAALARRLEIGFNEIGCALRDVGIFYCLEERVAAHLKRGELHVVLPDWSPVEPALHLYYPGHRQIPQGLNKLTDVLRSAYHQQT